jgi:hypothetical protein
MRIWGATSKGRKASKALHGGRRKPGKAATKQAKALAAEIAAVLRLINEKLRTA